MNFHMPSVNCQPFVLCTHQSKCHLGRHAMRPNFRSLISFSILFERAQNACASAARHVHLFKVGLKPAKALSRCLQTINKFYLRCCSLFLGPGNKKVAKSNAKKQIRRVNVLWARNQVVSSFFGIFGKRAMWLYRLYLLVIFFITSIKMLSFLSHFSYYYNKNKQKFSCIDFTRLHVPYERCM